MKLCHPGLRYPNVRRWTMGVITFGASWSQISTIERETFNFTRESIHPIND